jgi:hypothetical protein
MRATDIEALQMVRRPTAFLITTAKLLAKAILFDEMLVSLLLNLKIPKSLSSVGSQVSQSQSQSQSSKLGRVTVRLRLRRPSKPRRMSVLICADCGVMRVPGGISDRAGAFLPVVFGVK